MERFKICEKETKTKAFSKEGLGQQPKTVSFRHCLAFCPMLNQAHEFLIVIFFIYFLFFLMSFNHHGLKLLRSCV